jgi:tetratricopeptide (TPR) repeat protein
MSEATPQTAPFEPAGETRRWARLRRRRTAAPAAAEARAPSEHELRARVAEAAAPLLTPAGREDATGWLAYGQRLHALARAEEALHGRPSPHGDDALRAFQHAVELAPGEVEAWEAGGVLLLREGRAAAALPWLERATELQPGRRSAWNAKADALRALGRADDAGAAVAHGRRLEHLVTSEKPGSPLVRLRSTLAPVVHHVWNEKRTLALTAFLYVLGIGVWSVTSVRRDLTARPSADPQYLLAGVVPALLAAAALALLVLLFTFPRWFRDRLLARSERAWKALFKAGGILLTAGLAATVLASVTGVLDRVPLLFSLLGGAVMLGLLLIGLTKGDGVFNLVWYGYGAFAVVLVAAVGYAFYAERVYPSLPQALGGGKPRCAQLDLTASALSAATLATLAPGSNDPVVRTRHLDVLYSQGEVLFVRVAGGGAPIELRSGAVRAVVGCG